MKTINIKVNEHKLQHEEFRISSDTIQKYRIKFDFSGTMWDGLVVSAIFSNRKSDVTKIMILDNDNACVVPWEVLADRGDVYVNLVGSDVIDGELHERMTSFREVFCKIAKVPIIGDESIKPTPSEYEQLMKILADTREIAESIRADADAGKFDGKDGYTPIKGKDYFDGEPGKPGDPGAPGKDFKYEYFTPEQLASLKGEPGYTPQKNKDYFDGKDGKDYILTEADKEEIAEKVPVPDPYDDTELKAEIGNVKEGLSELETNVKSVNDNQDRELEILKAINDGQTSVDAKVTGEGYSVDLSGSANGLRVDRLTGESRTTKNLLNIAEGINSTNRGIVGTPNADGSVTFSGTFTESGFGGIIRIPSIVINGTYTFSIDKAVSNMRVVLVSNKWISRGIINENQLTRTFTIEDTIEYLCVSGSLGESIDITICPQLEKGSAVTPYEPYFEGIRSTELDSIVEVGKNLFDFNSTEIRTPSNIVGNGQAFTIKGENLIKIPVSVKKGEAFTISFKEQSDYADYQVTFVREDKYEQTVRGVYGASANTNVSRTYTLTQDILYFQIETWGKNQGITISDMQIEKGDTATPYEPYKKIEAPFPVSLKKWDSWEGGKKTVGTGVVDLGTLNWVYDTQYKCFKVAPNSIPNAKPVLGEVVCGRYSAGNETISGSYVDMVDKSYYSMHNYWQFVIKDLAFTDASTFKASLNGVLLYYEKAEPTVEDSAEPVSFPFFDGGSLTFSNPARLPVGYELTYTTKLGITKRLDEMEADIEVLDQRTREKEWVLKGTLTTDNKDIGVNVDLSGCTELMIVGYTVGTAGANLNTNITALLSGQFVGNGGRRIHAIYENDGLNGMYAKVAKYNDSKTASVTSGNLTAYTYIEKKLSDITRFFFSNTSVVTECNIEIYAR